MEQIDAWHDLDAYISLPRLTGLALNPAGDSLAVSVQEITSKKDSYVTHVKRIDLSSGAHMQLTRSQNGESNVMFNANSDLLFTSKRDAQKDPDDADKDILWCLPAAGGEAYPVAKTDSHWMGVITAPKGTRTVACIPWLAQAADAEKDAEIRKQRKDLKVSALLHERTPIRFWDHDLDFEQCKYLVWDQSLNGDCPDPDREIYFGDELAPPSAVSADGNYAVVNIEKRLTPTTSTSDLVVINLANGEKQTVFTGDQTYSWYGPVISHDGGILVALRGKESTAETIPDQQMFSHNLVTGETVEINPDKDLWFDPVAISKDGKTLYCLADCDGGLHLFGLCMQSGKVHQITCDGALSHVQIDDQEKYAYAIRTSYTCPGEVVRIDLSSGQTVVLDCGITYPEMPGTLERISATAADGKEISGYLVLPEGASAENPAPVLLWVHGGPIGSWNAFSWRWCPWLLASQGYAVVLPDPALSTGYGRDYIQRGWGRWGEEPFTDVLTVLDSALQRAELDETRTAMMGGSFGGYMANWIATHTDRFKAIVTHASLWNLDSFVATTDTVPYWRIEMTEDMRAKYSPHHFAQNISTPMLVIHGDKDYRVPFQESIQLWWQLNNDWKGKLEDMPHKFLYFPNENHWVLTPQHAKVWYETVRSFLKWQVLGQEWERPKLL